LVGLIFHKFVRKFTHSCKKTLLIFVKLGKSWCEGLGPGRFFVTLVPPLLQQDRCLVLGRLRDGVVTLDCQAHRDVDRAHGPGGVQLGQEGVNQTLLKMFGGSEFNFAPRGD
jgi:hypothetical protein